MDKIEILIIIISCIWIVCKLTTYHKAWLKDKKYLEARYKDADYIVCKDGVQYLIFGQWHMFQYKFPEINKYEEPKIGIGLMEQAQRVKGRGWLGSIQKSSLYIEGDGKGNAYVEWEPVPCERLGSYILREGKG